MSFQGPIYTDAGKALHNRLIGTGTLKFTKMQMGDGSLGGTTIAALTALINPLVTMEVQRLKQYSDYIVVTAPFTNATITTAFNWREIGLFAENPDYPDDRTKDILFCYQNAYSSAAPIPPGSQEFIERLVNIPIKLSDVSDVTITISESLIYALKDPLTGKIYPDDIPDLNYISVAQRGAANGVATLGDDGKVTPSQVDYLLKSIVAAADYDPIATYAAGAYCIKAETLYKCTTAITAAEAWTAAHWTATTVAAELLAIITALEWKASLGQLPNRNLLDNWDFQVNQRGQASYENNPSNPLAVDRWYLLNGNLDVHPRYITLKTLTSGDTVFMQRVPISSLIGGAVYTLSVMFSDKTVFSGIGTIPADFVMDGVGRISCPNGWWCDLWALSGAVSEGYILFRVFAPANTASCNLASVKLELSSVSTLAHDPPADYDIELWKCQKYFVRVQITSSSFLGFGKVASANSIYAKIDVPAPLRTFPAASNININVNNYKGMAFNITSATVVQYTNASVELLINRAENDLTLGDTFALYGSIDFVSEL